MGSTTSSSGPRRAQSGKGQPVRREEIEPIRGVSEVGGPTGAYRSGLLIVLSGPSGVGKSTIVDGLSRAWPFEFSVSATTRPPRPDEEPGVDYHFVNRAVFEAMADTDQFLEWAEYADNLYGTPRIPVVSLLESGADVLLDIEVNGAVQVMEAYAESVTIFVMPPSIEELEQRLRGRQDTNEAAVEGRMAVAEMQMTVGRERFTHLVVNHDVQAAVAHIVRILEGVSRCGTGEMDDPARKDMSD